MTYAVSKLPPRKTRELGIGISNESELLSQNYNASLKHYYYIPLSQLRSPLAPGVAFPPDILQFCVRHGLTQYLNEAIRLAQTHFSSIQELSLQLEQDPETGEEWIVIDIKIKGTIEEILNQYDRYTTQWITVAPWQRHQMIRLSYNIV